MFTFYHMTNHNPQKYLLAKLFDSGIMPKSDS